MYQLSAKCYHSSKSRSRAILGARVGDFSVVEACVSLLLHLGQLMDDITLSELSHPQLCHRFDDEMAERLGLTLVDRVEASLAGQEIRHRGRLILPAIAVHLRHHSNLERNHLGSGWGVLLSSMVQAGDPSPSVTEVSDILGWLRWLTRMQRL